MADPAGNDAETTARAIEISYQGWLLIGAAAAWGLNWFKTFILKILAFRVGAEPQSGDEPSRAVNKQDCIDYRSQTNDRIAHVERSIEDGLSRVHQRIDNLFESKKNER
jgi:hypothetical protein